MKQIILLSVLAIFGINQSNAQVKIGGTGSPNANAVLELDGGTNKGFLLPRVNTTQMGAMNTAPDGMMIYNSTDGFTYLRKGAAWQKITDATNTSGFALPYAGTSSNLGTAFAITQTAGFGDGMSVTHSGGGNALITHNGNNRLNTTSGNTGIGIPTGINDAPTLGRLVVRGVVGNTSAVFGDKTTGVSIENAFPGIAFNAYYNAGSKNLADGYSARISHNPVDGKMVFNSTSAAGTAGNSNDASQITRMVIDAAGNVGINTPSPLYKLNVKANNQGIVQETTDGTMRMGFYTNTTTGAILQTSSNHDLSFATNNSLPLMTLKTGGNFGVGTTTPAYKITSKGDGVGIAQESADGGVKVGFYANSGGAFVETITNHPLFFATADGAAQATLSTAGNFGVGTTVPAYKLTAATDGIGIAQENANGTVKMGFYTNASGAILETITNHPLNFATNDGVPSAVLTTGGNFGIGPSVTPTNRLDVGGRIRLRKEGAFGSGIWMDGPTVAQNTLFGMLDNNNFGFYSNTSGWKHYFDAVDGTVRFGTTQKAAGYLLNVGGKIISEEVRVQLRAAWPDYVFAKNYVLKPLDQLEKYIAENNHLPNMPSAAEIEKDGQLLGDVQRRLLEKVEELTLYIIDLKKEIDLLKKSK